MKTHRTLRAALYIAWLVLTACVSSPPAPTDTPTPLATATALPTLTNTPIPTATSTPTLTNTPEPLFSFRVLSYNILYGAGVERQFDSALPPEMVGKSRLPDLMSVIRAANPDIVGLQEANGWERGTPPVIQQVAQELGMNQFFAKTASGFHIGLMTKFKILDAENLSSHVGRQGVLRATLVSPKGERIHVFVVHLDPASPDSRLCEVNTLLHQMAPYAQTRTLLFGDMNFKPRSREYVQLEEAGWKSVAVEPSWGIDQIWISPGVKFTNGSWSQFLATPVAISDHNPIGAEINLYPTLAPNNASPLPPATSQPSPPATVASTPTLAPTPPYAADALTGIRLLRQERFDDPCAISRWNMGTTTAKFSNAMLEMTGVEPWQSLVSRHKEFSEGQGALLRFKLERDSELEIYFDNSGWNSDVYRRFGIHVLNKSVQYILWQGNHLVRGENLSSDPKLEPDVWYVLLLAMGRNGDLIAQLWDPGEPGRSYWFRDLLGERRTDLPWVFGMAANRGRVWIDSFSEITFNEIR